jgi:hypothetical protein
MQMRDLSSLPRPFNQRDRARSPYLKDIVKCIDWRANAGKWITIRLLPIDVDNPNSLVYTGTIWVKREIEKDGKVKEINYSRVAANFNPRTGAFNSQKDIDPFVERGVGRLDVRYVLQAIIRDIPTAGKVSKPTSEERKKGLDLGSATWTPIRVVELPQSVINMISGLKAINKVKGKGGKSTEYDVTHEKYGCDVLLKYTPDAKGPNKWSVNKGERTPLTEKELAYARWSLKPITEAFSSLSLDQARLDYEKDMGESLGGNESSSSGGGKTAKSGKKMGNYYTDNDDDSGTSDDDIKVKAAKKGGKKAVDEEDEDEAPVKKLKKKLAAKKVKGKKKKATVEKSSTGKKKLKSGKIGKKSKSSGEDDDIPF